MMKNLKTSEKEHVQGLIKAGIEIIEYADYQCSYCREAYYVIKKIQEELKENVRFVFRNFPLTDLHPNALHAAVAAEIADSEGKFWEMHDMLFKNQKNLEDADLIGYAKSLNLNMKKFEDGFDDITYYRKIEEDYKSGVENRVVATPTFFINRQKFEGDWSSPEFTVYLKSLL